MVQEFDVDVLGVGLRVVVDGMSDADFGRLRDQWRRVRSGRESGSREPSGTVAAVLGGHRLGADVPSADIFSADISSADVAELCVGLRQAINLRAIEARKGELLMFHAAGLADPATGDVIALIGPSGAGKTTAASSLGTVLGYVSDETVAVDATGRVIPFPKPLAVKEQGSTRKRITGPDELGLREVGGPLRISRIALLDRRDERVAPSVTTLGLEDVLPEIVEQTNYFAALPRALRRLESLIRVSGGVHVIRYHHAEDLVEPVSALLKRPAAHLAPPEAADEDAVRADVRTVAPGSYERSVVDDWIDVAGEVMVLSDGQISRLSALGSLIWRALRSPQTMPGLVAHAEEAFGHAPDDAARSTVQAMLDDLTAAGLVRMHAARTLSGVPEQRVAE